MRVRRIAKATSEPHDSVVLAELSTTSVNVVLSVVDGPIGDLVEDSADEVREEPVAVGGAGQFVGRGVVMDRRGVELPQSNRC